VALLEIENLAVDYGRVRALAGVSVRVEEGEIVALIGANGAGKTTLLRTISGLVRPTGGRIALADAEIAGYAPDRIVRLGVAHAPEGRRVFARMSVAENLALGAFARRGSAAVTLERVLTIFPRLRERLRQQAGTLSGGEQQMLALGRALMLAPKILLVDEPSVGLAPILVSRTIDAISEMKQRYQLTVLMAEQNFNQAIRIANRGYVIVHGKIAFEGRSTDELNNNDLIKKFYLGL
jgi:branched-chain amino acid transport system ATP-binding protein